MTRATRSPPPPRLRVVYWVYQAIAHLIAPIMIFVFLWRSRREPLYRSAFGQRFGGVDRQPPGSVWVFAASLGETRAVSPVIERLVARGHRIILTHSSPAGLREGRRLFADHIAHGTMVSAYVPLDLFWAVSRFLGRTAPRLGLVVESEIWPGLLVETRRRGIAMVQVNGNLTEATIDRADQFITDRRLRFLSLYDRVLTKSDRLKNNYLAAGLREEAVKIVGELKFDQVGDPAQVAAAMAIRGRLPANRTAFLIASSVEGEESQIDQIVAGLCDRPVPPLILWVPRSPQRFDAVATRLARQGIRVLRRSAVFTEGFAGEIPADAQVIVGDSLGEMAFYYGLADLVFVGGSLNGDGGHNIIEPLAQGRPVLMGPSTYGIRFPAEEAAEAGVFESLPDAAAVLARATALLEDPAALKAMAARTEAFHRRYGGAADRTVAALMPYLETSSTEDSAPEANASAETSVARDRPARLER